MTKRHHYSKIINSTYFNHHILSRHDWRAKRDIIRSYLKEITPDLQYGRNNLTTLVKLDNHLSSCSYKGYKHYFLNMPQYLLIEIVKEVFKYE